MKRRLLSSVFITACLWAIANLSEQQMPPQAAAKLSIAAKLSYQQVQK